VLFGRRSKKMDADQVQLLLSKNDEQSIVATAAKENVAPNAPGSTTSALVPWQWKPSRGRESGGLSAGGVRQFGASASETPALRWRRHRLFHG
jgi:hypothetical protein